VSRVAPRLKIQVGLAVDPKKAVYIVRPSDDELLKYLEEGEYCNVLCSRQMGKTSLLHRTRGRLAEKGIRSALIDVAGSLGTMQSADDWYLGLLQMVAGELDLTVDVRAWWHASVAATPNQRLIQFFREEIAGKTDRYVVTFLDEIDGTLKLPFTDDLFVAIRSMYNDRVREPAYGKLVFCLVGVATPNELIKERRTTPYNVGRTVELRDYDPEQDDLGPLQRAVSENPPHGETVVRAVLRWTGGHPYLTARLCEDFMRKGGRSPEDVDRMVEEGYSNLRELERDIHFEPALRFMQKRVEDRSATLQLYRRIWRGRREPDRVAPAQIALKLAGLVKRDDRGLLVVRNPIYRRVFTDRWAREAMPALDRRLRATRYIAAVAVVAAVLAAWLQAATQQISTLEHALDDYGVALDAHRKLKRLPPYEAKANELLAGFYERRALRAEIVEDRDQAILWRLRAQGTHPTSERARRMGELAGLDYKQLIATFHMGAGARRDALGLYFAYQVPVALSPDGSRVLTGSDDNTASLWSASDGSPIGQPMKHSSLVRAVAFSPDGSRVLTGSDDNIARLWSASDGSPVGQPMKHSDSVLVVAFSPDGSRVLTGSNDNTARLWSASDGSPIGQPMKHSSLVLAVAFGPDGSRVLTGDFHNTARLWSASDGSPVGQPMHHSDSVRAVAFSPDGQKVLTGSDDNTAHLWSASDGSPIGQSMKHSDSVRAVAFSPDSQRVLTGSDDNTARLWSASDGSPIGQSMKHSDSVRAVAFSPDGQRVLTGSDDNTARLWSTSDGSPIGQPLKHSGSVRAVAFGPDGSRVLTGSFDNTARLWHASDGPPIGQPMQHPSLVRAIAFGPDGSRVLTSSNDNTVRLWNASDGSPIGQLMKHSDSVGAIAFSPDGSRILTSSFDNTARLWSASDGSPIGQPMQHSDSVRAIAFSPDGSRVLTSSFDNTVRLWSASDGSLIGHPMQHSDSVRTVAFSPDGSRILTGSDDNSARLWSASDGSPMGQPLKHSGSVHAVAFSPDSSRVFTGSDDNTAHLWSTSDGAPVGQSMKHSSLVRAVAFSPDGQKVLTSSDDNTIRLWSTSDGSPIGQPLKHSDWVRVVAFSPDGQKVLTLTRWWIHVVDASDFGRPIIDTLLPAPFMAFQPSDSTGARLRVAVAPTGDSVRILELEPGRPASEPLEGDPAHLLEEWQRKLGLRITEAGAIEAVR